MNALSGRLDSIFHCAASTTLNLPLGEAREINVQGTNRVLDLAEQSTTANPAFRLHYVSTAFVAGATERTVRASDLQVGGSFRNTYEQVKAEAEHNVRQRQHRIQTTIYRPSVICGDSITGRTSAFNVMYVPARLLILGLCKAIPALPHTPFDIVPINYVADAIFHLSSFERSIGECYHLSAGVGRESSPLEVYDSLLAAFDRAKSRRPQHLRRPLFISPELLSRAFTSISAAAHGMMMLEKKVTEHLTVFTQLVPFIPYMLSNPRFDTTETMRDLDPRIGPPPLFAHYAERVFDYCFQTNWGKKPLAALQYGGSVR